MRFLAWIGAFAALLIWSAFAWIAYGFSDWIAGVLGALFSGVLSAELGPWATWLTTSLGDIVQFAIIVAWGLVALLILAAPILLGRRDRSSGNRSFVPRYADGWHDERPAKSSLYGATQYERAHGSRPAWRDKSEWKRGYADVRAELDRLKWVASEQIKRHGKTKKKRRKWDD